MVDTVGVRKGGARRLDHSPGETVVRAREDSQGPGRSGGGDAAGIGGERQGGSRVV